MPPVPAKGGSEDVSLRRVGLHHQGVLLQIPTDLEGGCQMPVRIDAA